MNKFRLYYNSPIGNLEIVGTTEGIENILFVHMLNDYISCCPGLNSFTTFASNSAEKNINDFPETMRDCVYQLDEYFSGSRIDFQIKLNPKGTDFQQRVWDVVKDVPFGRTSSYLEIASKLGISNAVRAIGNANGKNPIPILIPCHRIIGSNGNLTGYAGGLLRKQWLLSHELTLEPNLFF